MGYIVDHELRLERTSPSSLAMQDRLIAALPSLALAQQAPAIAVPGEAHHGLLTDMTRDTAMAHAERMFDRMDRNGDGRIDGADRTARLEERFRAMDTDRSGQVSLDEMKAAVAMRSERRGNRRPGMARKGPDHANGGTPETSTPAPRGGVLTRQDFIETALTRFDRAAAGGIASYFTDPR